MVTVFIPAQLKEMTGGVTSVEVDASNIRQVVEQLEQQFPGIQQRLCDGDNLRSGLQVSIDSVMTSRGLIAKVQPGNEVHFVPAFGGG
ncbi:MAG: MoaD/ThiS family protein [Pirellulaceae bacterium]